jgi:hypothetical protein
MISHGKAERQAARAARLAQALRENLKRRKAQARGRTQNRSDEQAPSPGHNGAETEAPDFRRNRGRD